MHDVVNHAAIVVGASLTEPLPSCLRPLLELRWRMSHEKEFPLLDSSTVHMFLRVLGSKRSSEKE